MTQRIVHGNVNADGTPFGPAREFTVNKLATGTYMVTFQPPFASIPTVVMTQNHPAFDAFDSPGLLSTDNCVVVAVDENQFKCITGDGDGDKRDRNFMFIAIGQ